MSLMIEKLFDVYPFLPYIIIVILIVLSAFFSGSEIALASVNTRRLKKSAEEGSSKSALALKMSENYDKVLPAILMGNNLVNIAASSVATVIALKIFSDSAGLGATVSTVIMTVLILIFGEIIPKLLANEQSEKFSENVSFILRAYTIIIKPVVFIIEMIVKLISKLWKNSGEDSMLTEDDLLTIIETVEDEGVIDEEKSELLQSAIGFDEITVREVLTPRVDMFAIDIDDDISQNIEKIIECDYSRIPVYRETTDNILGILYLNEFMKAMAFNCEIADLSSFLHEATYVHQSMKLDNVLKEFKEKQCHMAIVTDEYGGTMGLLTMEDVVEEIVGDIWDEKDTITSETTAINDNTYEISGDMALFDFCDQFDLNEELIDSDCVTVGGLCIEKLNSYPDTGDEFDIENIHLTVVETEDMRVKKVIASIREKDDSSRDSDQ